MTTLGLNRTRINRLLRMELMLKEPVMMAVLHSTAVEYRSFSTWPGTDDASRHGDIQRAEAIERLLDLLQADDIPRTGANMAKLVNCYDCGVKPGELHQYGCDIERCAECGGQKIFDDCDPEVSSPRLPWSGRWPNEEDCERYNLWAKKNPNGPGYVACEKDDPGAVADQTRLVTTGRWDKKLGRFVIDSLEPVNA